MRNMYSIVRIRGLNPAKVNSMSRRLSYNVPHKALSTMGSIVCPACHHEVNIGELVKRREKILCPNCEK